MINAKDELLEILGDDLKIKCAFIEHTREYYGGVKIQMILKIDYSEVNFNNFLRRLNFEYANGYGIQELYGTVWLTDGTWLERSEYDGSECWEHKKLPKIPNECI